MSESKEFDGKTIDLAIDAACAHFDCDRTRLEVEIVNDARGGLFGLVGAKKAVVRARLMDNQAETKAMAVAIVERLVDPIVGAIKASADMDGDRIRVLIRDVADSGLLIGREGQTLAAVQYLANRILSKRVREAPRIHIDAGDYRERQDDSLRQLALELADKVKAQGRPQSTRPLSSYHRRVVHMALQEDDAILTRSKGDGPMKRVLILPKRDKGAPRQARQA
ncbi:MAG: RNA-binding cell elongation regulator Jag/EloR [Desulfovibrionaceae bacterium]